MVEERTFTDAGSKLVAFRGKQFRVQSPEDDPVGMEQAKKVLPELTYCVDEYECAIGAEALVICTEWEQFRALDFARLKTVMVGKPAIVDLRNIYPPDEIAQRGFVYESVGRSKHVDSNY